MKHGRYIEILISSEIIDSGYEPEDEEGNEAFYESVVQRIPEAEAGHVWSVASEYVDTGKVIKISDSAESRRYDPFGTGGPLTGLLRLGKSETQPMRANKILDWVNTYGLLERTEEQETLRSSLVRQKEMHVSDFWLEAKNMHTALKICGLLRNGAFEELVSLGKDLSTNPRERRLCDFEKHLKDTWGQYGTRNPDKSRQEIRHSAIPLMFQSRFRACLGKELSRVSVNLSPYQLLQEHAPLEHERVRHPNGLVLKCPDLRSALYLQLALVMGKATQIGFCIVCGGPYIKACRKSLYCEDSCKMRAYRARKNTD